MGWVYDKHGRIFFRDCQDLMLCHRRAMYEGATDDFLYYSIIIMKRQLLLTACAILGAAMAKADGGIVTLDLTKATTPLEFNSSNGSWTETYNDEATVIDSQCFSFIHGALGEYQTWWGFTASNSADNSRPEITMLQQWSNMACGGIVLDDNGEVKKDEHGAPVVDTEVPYLVAYYSPYMSRRSIDMVFTEGKSYDPQGVYLNNNSYPYYCIEYGDAFARAFTNGDDFTLTIHGVSADGTEKTMDVSLASYTNGDLTINRGWRYVDLTPLGTVNELYFTMASTDTGDWGMNTPGYFCLDKLMVKAADTQSQGSMMADSNTITYDKAARTVTVGGGAFASICNISGQIVMSGEGTLDISGLAAGVYIVKSGNNSLKIAR